MIVKVTHKSGRGLSTEPGQHHDDLFGGYFGAPYPAGGTFGSVLDLTNPTPMTGPTLAPNAIGANFDPDHSHKTGFVPEAAGNYSGVKLGCPKVNGHLQRPPDASVYSYVPAPEPSPYVAMISNFAYANHVLQANEGPSYVAHQYAIAGQSRGKNNSNAQPPFNYAPNAQIENPGPAQPAPDPTGNFDEETPGAPMGNCFPQQNNTETTIDLVHGIYPGQEANPHPPCAEYSSVLDEIDALGTPSLANWQYIASARTGIWAAPMAINHLYQAYVGGQQNFAVDQDALQFVKDIGSSNPSKPFAALTYITPCIHESDHPITNGNSDGPAWLAYVVNAIGNSQYWPHTTIIVTWDDWGGFYDHFRYENSSPFHPLPNPYSDQQNPQGNPSDPNEWGFRVPMLVISPYVKSRGYVSSVVRSQSAMLNYIESTFNLGSLQTDDMTNGSDNLGDMFNFATGTPGFSYVPITGGTQFNPSQVSTTCTNG